MRTVWFAYSGIHFAIGSSSRNFPSSNSIIRADDTTGFVIDIRTKMVSRVIGTPLSRSRQPWASKWTTFPLRATSVTAPAMRSVSMYSCTKSSIRASRSDDMPTDSALATTMSSAAFAGGIASTPSARPTHTTRTGQLRRSVIPGLICCLLSAASCRPARVMPRFSIVRGSDDGPDRRRHRRARSAAPRIVPDALARASAALPALRSRGALRALDHPAPGVRRVRARLPAQPGRYLVLLDRDGPDSDPGRHRGDLLRLPRQYVAGGGDLLPGPRRSR